MLLELPPKFIGCLIEVHPDGQRAVLALHRFEKGFDRLPLPALLIKFRIFQIQIRNLHAPVKPDRRPAATLSCSDGILVLSFGAREIG